MARISFNINNSLQGDLSKKLSSLSVELQEQVMGTVKENITAINAEQVSRAPVYDGEIRQQTSFDFDGSSLYTLFCNAPHGAYMEFGTGKKIDIPAELSDVAASFKGMASGSADQAIEALKRWTRLKGIQFDSAAMFKSGKRKGENKQLTTDQTAYIIWHFIILNGIKPHPFFFGPYLEKRKKMVDDVENKINDLLND